MSSIKALRNRIKSVKSTQKITKAMRMVAVSKLNKAKISANFASIYRQKITALLSAIKNSSDIYSSSPMINALLSPQKNFNATILIVYGSDRGLCGPYNANILKKLREDINHYPRPKVICVGKKLNSIISKIITPSFVVSAYEDPKNVASQIQEFVAKELDNEPSCQIVSYFTKFVNTLTLVPSKFSLGPVDDSCIDNQDPTIRNIDFEGQNLIEKLSDKYFESNIIANLYESIASSQASCMAAMDNATRNAGSMIEQLTLKMNRTRQSVITNELIEVISGAEAV